MTPELHRPLPADRVDGDGLEITVEANPAECAALARRLQVPELRSLTCHYHLSRSAADGITAKGRLRAQLLRTCVVSLEDFDAAIEEDFTVRFVPAGEESQQIDPDAEDEIPFEGGMLDLGEAAAEQLALALDPYPRKPGEELPELDPEDSPHPFAALAARRH